MTSMTPSSITSGQIGKLEELFGAGLRKSGLPSEPTQQVIEDQGDSLVAELVSAVRKRVEAVSNLIVRRVKVDRSRSPQEAFDATGRRQHIDRDVTAAMLPRGEGEEVDVYFFKVGRYATDAELEKEYKVHGLKPADVYSLAAVNEADPAFGDKRPNATHWQNNNGQWCYATFDRWGGERDLRVDHHAGGWYAHWWFAGLRK